MPGVTAPTTTLFAEDAEQAVVGAILKRNQLMSEAAASLRPQDFSGQRERLIFTRMMELWEAGSLLDELTITHAMTEPGELQKAGGVAFVSELADSVTRHTLEPYIAIIRDRARRRQLMHLCEVSRERASDPTSPIADSVEQLREGLLGIETNNVKTTPLHVAQMTDQALNEWDRVREQPTELAGLSTGISSADSATTGIRPGEYWVVGAAPGDGKTSMGITVLLENAKRDIPVAIFSLEMTRDQVLHRLWAQYGNISYALIRNPRSCSHDDIRRIQEAALQVGKMPIFIDDSSGLSIRELSARARLLVHRHGVKLIAVDYLQLISADGRDERQRISVVSNSLRELAKEAAPMLALSQLARPKDRSLNARPNKFWLKESGALEADAHCVLLLFRPRDEYDQPTGRDELIIAKQRNGPTGIEPVAFDENVLRYRERTIR